MGSKYSDNTEAISDINVVPLVDIILVVLIIFMVTAPMIMKSSIPVTLPKAATGEASPSTQLNITLSGEGKIFLNDKEIGLEDLLSATQGEMQANPEIQAIIAADKDVPHGQVVQVLDLIKQAGIKKFGISIEKVQR